MSFRASLKNLIRRDAERPSLRERAADLRASLSRRTIMTASLAAAVPLPALAMPALNPKAAPHPDRALLDAEAECIRAEAAADAAEKASAAAYKAFRAALGPIPADLLMTPWEAASFGMICGTTVVRLPTYCLHHDDLLNPY